MIYNIPKSDILNLEVLCGNISELIIWYDGISINEIH